MAPKKKDPKQEKGEAKALERQKQKTAEDKTFGLKNKNKSKAVQKYIKGVQSQVQGNPKKGGEAAEIAAKKQQQDAKKRDQQQAALLASLFKGTENVKKVEEANAARIGTYDPKTSKEDQKIDMYSDQRVQKSEGEWNEERLSLLTDIVCRHFLEAVEKRQYGWFWVCPDGDDACKYRHCLPPGYVLSRDARNEDGGEEDEEETIEEKIERERAALAPGGTKVTLETFLQWKKRKEEERLREVEAARMAEAKKSGGKGLRVLSGRDLYAFDPTLFVDDDGAAEDGDYEEDEEYWVSVINENQKTLDDANSAALAEAVSSSSSASSAEGGLERKAKKTTTTKPSSEGVQDSDKREDGGAGTDGIGAIKEDLFLQDDVPDDLDVLDDDDEDEGK